MADFQGEKLEKDLSTKQVYHYIDSVQGINQISREVFKKRDEIVHYPRGFEGGSKYKTIKKFVFRGFTGDLSKVIGVYKSENYGYGFTKKLRPFSEYLENEHNFTEVIIEKGGKTEIDRTNKKLYLNLASLAKLHGAFLLIFNKNKAEVDQVLRQNLFELFPKDVKKPKLTYIPGTLATSLSSWGSALEEFSDVDKAAITDLFDRLALAPGFLTSDWLSKTKELIDSKYIAAALKEFKSLRARTTEGESLEKKWQAFLRENNWIFSSIFAQPVILHQDEAYVGGKTIDNKNGKLNDFLIKNSLSDNVSFVEIKTHLTKLLEPNAYRGNDVFAATKDLTGCVGQVLNQRDNFQKHFYALKGTSEGSFETFNSKCLVLIGSLSKLNKKQRHCFELYRNNSQDVEILTFDELQTKIESLQKLLTK